MPRMKVNGVELEVEAEGDGDEVILFIMGIGAQHIWWPDGLLENLRGRGMRTIRYDNRDVGLSQSLDHLTPPPVLRWMPLALLQRPLPAPYTLDDMADDAAAILDALDIEKAHVVGVSMGGMIGQCMALRHRDRVQSLTLLMTSSGSRRNILGKPSAIRALLKTGPKTADEAGPHSMRLYEVIGSPGWPLDEELIHRKARMAFERGLNPKGFLRQFGAILAGADRTPRLRELEGMPVTVIHGAQDPLIPVAAGRHLAKAIPGARLEVIEGMGHTLPAELVPRYEELIVETAQRGR